MTTAQDTDCVHAFCSSGEGGAILRQRPGPNPQTAYVITAYVITAYVITAYVITAYVITGPFCANGQVRILRLNESESLGP